MGGSAMSVILRNMKDMTDSRELYEAKAHPVISIFLYILVTLIAVALIWSYFGEIDIVVKGNGVVRPNEKVSSIKSKVNGKISEVHYSAGKKIKKGDILLVLESGDLEVQTSSLQMDYDKIQKELTSLLQFKESMLPRRDQTGEYQQIDLKSDQVSLQNLILEVNRNRNSFVQLERSLADLTLLEESIRSARNLFQGSGSEYENKYTDYTLEKRKLENTVRQQENAYTIVTKTAVIEDMKAAQKQLEDSKLDLDNYTNKFQLNLRSSIEETKRKLDTNKLDSDKNYVELNNLIQIDQDKIKKLNEQLAVSKLNIDDRVIRSPSDGIVNVLIDLKEGELLAAGTEFVTIVPENNTEYVVQVALSNKDIAKIKPGDPIKYHFLALPYKEYGELVGTIRSIGADAIVNAENGSSFYSIEAAITNKPLFNSKGEAASIKPGMMAEANVVTSSKKILYYLLEKIDLKE
ncbi:HlyD family efflux transporter periplasmic adaptor subunit [Paenibacillus sp. LMG 31457]|uniref:HlyD family efflux transporter periplasmic adaptor subunit n=2 Tax=Paenibacillus planticolens TaxID=2654976 RepID=A0ABX1ZJR5_9BACL|nr:HlyD family efflux transporter periplasmic adaptor subunit [Paenibacillus planticolens]